MKFLIYNDDESFVEIIELMDEEVVELEDEFGPGLGE